MSGTEIAEVAARARSAVPEEGVGRRAATGLYLDAAGARSEAKGIGDGQHLKF